MNTLKQRPHWKRAGRLARVKGVALVVTVQALHVGEEVSVGVHCHGHAAMLGFCRKTGAS